MALRPELDRLVTAWSDLGELASMQRPGNGDYWSWPHMDSKKTWKQAMYPAAHLAERHVGQRQGTVESCLVCGDLKGEKFADHVASAIHYNNFSERCPPVKVNMDRVREELWQVWNVAADCELRFNHADGRLQERRCQRGLAGKKLHTK